MQVPGPRHGRGPFLLPTQATQVSRTFSTLAPADGISKTCRPSLDNEPHPFCLRRLACRRVTYPFCPFVSGMPRSHLSFRRPRPSLKVVPSPLLSTSQNPFLSLRPTIDLMAFMGSRPKLERLLRLIASAKVSFPYASQSGNESKIHHSELKAQVR